MLGTITARLLRLAVCGAAAAALCACSEIEPEFLPMHGVGSFGAPKSPAEVRLFVTKKPEFKYEELGLVTLDTAFDSPTETEVYERLRRKAAEIGADGIIILNSQSSVHQAPDITYDFYGNPIMTNYTYSVIKYRAMAIRKL